MLNLPYRPLNLLSYLLNHILKLNPKQKKPNLNTWAKDIDLAIRIDGRTVQELKECINWIYSPDGSFWQKNILSGKKLREQFDKMIPYFKKGSPIIVFGELNKPEIFTDREGRPQISMNITAQNLLFSPFGRPDSQGGAAP